MKKHELNPLAAGLSVGLLWGVALFIWTLVAVQQPYGQGVLDLLSEVYPMYAISSVGAFWGLLWGFLDGFIGIYVLVWLYNFFVKKLAKK